MTRPNRFLPFFLLLGFSWVQLQCSFPSDWEFAPTSTGGDGGAGSTSASTGSMASSSGGGSNMCAANTGDCDMNPGNGCETNLTSVTNCGACGVACDPPNTVNPCTTGTCMASSCVSPYGNCDGVVVNGCEANLLTDVLNCGVCGKACMGSSANCSNGACIAGCPPDKHEPNDAVQAPAAPPMPTSMVVFDSANNDFKTSAGRTVSLTPGFTSNTDTDVFYLHVTDDTPLPGGKTAKGAGFDITVNQIPAGATYRVTSYFYCDDGSTNITVFNMNPAACPINASNTGFIGEWWHCEQSATAPSFSYNYGQACKNTGNANGILQIEVKVIGGPTQPTCNPYTLSVRITAISV